jgi:hypothetical protein
MARVGAAFPNGEVAAWAVNFGESAAVVQDYLADTGLRSPILLDNANEAGGCYVVPGGAATLTEHFQLLVGNPDLDPPFPLHVVIAPDRTFAYLNRDHDPDAVVQVLTSLLTQ